MRFSIRVYDTSEVELFSRSVWGTGRDVILACKELAKKFKAPLLAVRRRFLVSSESDFRVKYVVDYYEDGTASCTCNDFLYRQAEVGGRCKHIRGCRSGDGEKYE